MGLRGVVGIRRVRWLAGGGAAVVAAIVAVTLAVQSGAAPACAAPGAVAAATVPADGTPRQGKATFYDSEGGGGNCSFVTAPADRRYVALGPSEYAGAAACGGYLEVTGPNGTVRVLVMDQCPECPTGHIDLSREAFAEIADPVQGEVPVIYRSIANPPVAGPLTFRMKDGTSQWWFAVLVGNHGNPLVSLQAKGPDGDWRTAQREDYNYWVVDGGIGPGPYTIQVTDVHGQQATVSGIELAPELVQPTTVHMYAAGGAPAAPAPAPSTPSSRPGTQPPATNPAAAPDAEPGPVRAFGTASPAASGGCDPPGVDRG